MVRMRVVENRCRTVCDMMMQFPSYRRQWLDIQIQYRKIQFESNRMKLNLFPLNE